MKFRSTFLKNALSNVVRGGASSLVALILPYFLSRALDADRFAAWALVLQMAAYANFLDFGLQTAIARFIAQATELRQNDRRDQLISTSAALLLVAGGIAYLLIALAIWMLPFFFHNIPIHLVPEFCSAALLLSGSAVLVIALSSFPSTLIGLHRNDLVALPIGLSRLCGAIAAIFVARHTQSLVPLAACIGGANVLGALVQIPMVRNLLPDVDISIKNIRRSLAIELARYCAGLTVWNVGLLIVSGLDLLLVGHYRFDSVGSYSIALSAATLFAGVNSYIVTALLAPLSVLHARRDTNGIAAIVLGVTSIDVVANGFVALSTFVLALPLLKFWVGAYAAETLPLLQILMIAQAIRLSGLTFSVTLVAIGEQNKGMAQGWVEALVNLICSIVGIIWFGPIGVAWGTLIGSLCSFGWICFVTMRKVDELPLSSSQFFREGVLRPLVCLTPMLLLVSVASHLSVAAAIAAELVVLPITFALSRYLLPLTSLLNRKSVLPVT